MTNEEREIDFLIAELEREIRLMQARVARLERVESAAKAVVNSFTSSIDYDSWDKALDKLETILKEKP
jgi:ribosome-associated translation inhibitor RaiA